MLDLADYRIFDKLHESDNSLIYRGQRVVDDRPIILKILKELYPPLSKIARFKREFDITRELKQNEVKGIVDVYDLFSHNAQWVMVVEDFGGNTIGRLGLSGQLELVDFLRLASQLARILGRVHEHDIIHKDINPSNIVYNPQTNQVKLIDFGIATVYSREKTTFSGTASLEGTLPYISPEQTGRMNRALDYRTDFYSLGVTFYQMLTGQLPFTADDALALVHCHLATLPIPPNEIDPSIPRPISDIILKLMAKNAELRYQSAWGLYADLQTCLKQLEETGKIQSFTLAQHDQSSKFQIPQQLYGRDDEIKQVLQSFRRMVSRPEWEPNPRNEVLFVTGSPGVGKSTLVHEVYRPLTTERGYFLSGKFEQLQRDVPYAAFSQALNAFCDQLLTENEERLAMWREQIQEAIFPNGKLLLDIIPNLEKIVGEQPDVPHVEAQAAQHRFQRVFQNFLNTLSQPEHPIVMFLDDLQWADSGSLQLMKGIIINPNLRYILIIGSYRDGEVSAGHGLSQMMGELTEEADVQHIRLKNLGQRDVLQLLVDTLNCDPNYAQSLSDLIWRKTQGNAFFTTEFLKALYNERLVHFDHEHTQTWQWDLAQIRSKQITDNVVDLMMDKLGNLSAQTQALLQLAACIGNQFDLRTLTAVYHLTDANATIGDVLQRLRPALADGFVYPLDDGYKLADVTELLTEDDETQARFKFQHDRVQQAAYTLVDEQSKPNIHLQIGRILKKQTPADHLDERLFEIVNQYNNGRSRLRDSEEKRTLANLNLRAGRKAKAATAYEPAFQYLKHGADLLPASTWQTNYELTHALYAELAETAYLSGHFNQMESLAQIGFQHATAVLDRVPFYEAKIQAYIALNKLGRAVEVALDALAELGHTFPKKPKRYHAMMAYMKIRARLLGKSIETLAKNPPMDDAQTLAIMRIITAVGLAAYFTAPSLYPLLTFARTTLSITKGNSAYAAYSYCAYGLILAGRLDEIEMGHQFGQLAMQLIEAYPDPRLQANTYYTYNATIHHWKEHLNLTLDPLLQTYQIGLDSGSLEYAEYSTAAYAHNAIQVGLNLAKVDKIVTARHGDFARGTENNAHHLAMQFQQLAHNLMGKAPDPAILAGSAYNIRHMATHHVMTDERINIFANHYLSLMLQYLFNAQNHSEKTMRPAVQSANEGMQYLNAGTGLYATAVFNMYDSLARLALHNYVTEEEQKALLKQVEENQKQLTNWAKHAPMNFEHKRLLVKAELSRVYQDARARDYYDRAIALARENQFISEVALACELAGRFYQRRNQPRLAQTYLRDAHYAYNLWGANAKVHQLEAQYPYLDTPAPSSTLSESGTLSTTSTASTLNPTMHGTTYNTAINTTALTNSERISTLDLFSVIKATQVISSQLNLDSLLDSLLEIIMENVGAQHGTLLLQRNDNLWIEKVHSTTLDWLYLEEAAPIQSAFEVDGQQIPFPDKIIRYVGRSKETVVLNNASAESNFRTPYITKRQPKSILCTPLINQGQLIGVIYLENNLTTNAFTKNRVEIVSMLGTQATISITNAQAIEAYAECERLRVQNDLLADQRDVLEQKVQERTAELNRAYHSLERIDKAKADFIAVTSHELRTPITVIKGYTQVLEHMTTDDGMKSILSGIVSGTNRMHDIVNSMLDVSKIDNQTLQIIQEDVALNQVISNVGIALEKALQERDIQFFAENLDTLPLIQGDGELLQKAILQLVTNAIKFTPDGGKITIEGREIDSDWIEIVIADTGIGIEVEQQEVIFEKFYQTGEVALHSSGKTKFKGGGPGLGLAIARGIIMSHGGRIWVESEGKDEEQLPGSQFFIHLPHRLPESKQAVT